MTHEYRLPIDGYDFLAEINPSQNVIIARYESDGLLYVCWPELGYRIKLVLPQFCWMAFQQHKIEHIEFFF